MLVAVISDIHGNAPAIEAVLSAIDDADCKQVWCLGDTVGYGASPNTCLQLVRERCDLVLAGNHDLAVSGGLSISEFSAGARIAAEWTQTQLDQTNLDYLRSLKPELAAHDCGLFHASPRDPVWEYVLSDSSAYGAFEASQHSVTLVGHSHLALSFSLANDGMISHALHQPDSTIDFRTKRHIFNPGSVGQPRDRNPDASWLLLDLERKTAQWQRTEYDVEKAAEAVIAAGLPESIGQRLFLGQ